MKRKDRITQEVEKTFNVFENLSNLEENPFLYTRIQASLNSSPGKKKSAYFLRPIMVALLLIFNLITGIFFVSSMGRAYASDKQNLESLIGDYKFNQTYNDFLSNN